VCVKDYGRVLAERTEQVHDVLQYGRDAATVTLARTNRRSFTPADRHPPLTDRREYIGIFADRVSEQSKKFGRVRPSVSPSVRSRTFFNSPIFDLDFYMHMIHSHSSLGI